MVAKYVPSLGWLSNYRAGWLRFDLVVGKSIGCIQIRL
jgi:MFS superfamily sulfate permease-like transporter